MPFAMPPDFSAAGVTSGRCCKQMHKRFKKGLKMKKLSKKTLSALLGALCLLITVSSVSTLSSPAPGRQSKYGMPGMFVTAEAAEPQYTDFEDLNGKTIGLNSGAPFEELIRSKIPGLKEFLYFSSGPDMMAALKAGKIDAYFMNDAVGSLSVNLDNSIAIFPQPLGDTTYGFAFKKNSKERAKWQEAYDKIPKETLQELFKKWTGADESIKTLPEQDWPGSNGTVRVAACDTQMPMSYRGQNGQILGFDIEVILLMAKELDVHVDITGMEFSSVMPTIESGKAEIGTGSIVVSKERKELVDFIEYYPAAYILIVRSAAAAEADAGILSSLKGSFYRTFIKENRYKMVIDGLFTTIVMSAFSGLFGLILAFALIFLRYSDNPVANRVIAVYRSLMSGIPAVVILMVLYYIVFGKATFPAIFVAIVGFTLLFASRAFGVIWNTLESVDPGQREAALALGYTEARAFREIIIPQTRRIIQPLLVAQFVALVKETSVAGYISVLELTRVGDLIRGRTLEAFFPLMAIALLYFVLIRCLEKGQDLLQKYYAHKREERKIKGVDA